MTVYLMQSVYSLPIRAPASFAFNFLMWISPHSVTSVFFGGGTPSLAPPSTIEAVLDSVSKRARLSGDAEVTLEVNPTPVGLSQLEDYCRAGVNRFSIGVQVNFLLDPTTFSDKWLLVTLFSPADPAG